MTQITGSKRASWFDPSSDNTIEIAIYPPNVATVDFTTPGNNGDGDPDWVLVLESLESP